MKLMPGILNNWFDSKQGKYNFFYPMQIRLVQFIRTDGKMQAVVRQSNH